MYVKLDGEEEEGRGCEDSWHAISESDKCAKININQSIMIRTARFAWSR